MRSSKFIVFTTAFVLLAVAQQSNAGILSGLYNLFVGGKGSKNQEQQGGSGIELGGKLGDGPESVEGAAESAAEGATANALESGAASAANIGGSALSSAENAISGVASTGANIVGGTGSFAANITQNVAGGEGSVVGGIGGSDTEGTASIVPENDNASSTNPSVISGQAGRQGVVSISSPNGSGENNGEIGSQAMQFGQSQQSSTTSWTITHESASSYETDQGKQPSDGQSSWTFNENSQPHQIIIEQRPDSQSQQLSGIFGQSTTLVNGNEPSNNGPSHFPLNGNELSSEQYGPQSIHVPQQQFGISNLSNWPSGFQLGEDGNELIGRPLPGQQTNDKPQESEKSPINGNAPSENPANGISGLQLDDEFQKPEQNINSELLSSQLMVNIPSKNPSNGSFSFPSGGVENGPIRRPFPGQQSNDKPQVPVKPSTVQNLISHFENLNNKKKPSKKPSNENSRFPLSGLGNRPFPSQQSNGESKQPEISSLKESAPSGTTDNGASGLQLLSQQSGEKAQQKPGNSHENSQFHGDDHFDSSNGANNLLGSGSLDGAIYGAGQIPSSTSGVVESGLNLAGQVSSSAQEFGSGGLGEIGSKINQGINTGAQVNVVKGFSVRLFEGGSSSEPGSLPGGQMGQMAGQSSGGSSGGSFGGFLRGI